MNTYLYSDIVFSQSSESIKILSDIILWCEKKLESDDIKVKLIYKIKERSFKFLAIKDYLMITITFEPGPEEVIFGGKWFESKELKS